MARLELILISVLQFEVISGMLIYKRLGEDAVLPCGFARSVDRTCPLVSWLYDRDQNQTLSEVENGKVMESSVRAARLSVDTQCSLVISGITAEDVGLYSCQSGRGLSKVYLIVLTISPSPPDAEPKRDEVTLECSLLRHRDLGSCRQNSVNWLNETGSMLRGEGDGYTFLGQIKCVSGLTVKRHSAPNRKYTCRFVALNGVKIEDEYTPDFSGGITSDPASTGWTPLSYVMLALRVGGLIVLIVITVVLIRNRCDIKPHDDDDKGKNQAQYENVEAPSAAARRC